ncbi:hypothetical protein OBBRIDRAFT_830072 [Obba rivulosa]|uniref:Mitochondrial import inner membrane translocase subunit Tim21 n=1 Tax=Obba rivulosa TaxID=1052685 RepID=A0A8E2DVJ1_9APHY|nr:hypothetical protein OBBRIDRAFT_830072 [Obba rivulosa]
MEQKFRDTRRQDQAGPFRLGINPETQREAANAKKWSELNTTGKFTRATARTTNLAVILLGAGLSTVLMYALFSELYSKNSPTVLYGEACERIKASPQVSKYLQPPYIFHNNPPMSVRPKHRNHHVSSQLVLDSSGKEHMLLHFYVQGSPPGSSSHADESFFESVVHRVKDATSTLGQMSLNELAVAVQARAERTLETAKQMFRFLSGDVTPAPAPPPPLVRQEKKEVKKESGWTSAFTGIFSSVRGATRSTPETPRTVPDGKMYDEGEVHADLVMNDQGYYEFRYLLIDVPNSHTWSSKRIFVERAEGVRENEPVMRWYT